MCGITGIYNLKKSSLDTRKIIKEMTDKLVHRGPDDEGYFLDSNIALGHRRLSIIDLSRLGHQPMFYDKENLVIVYNGEVYNYLELKTELIQKGYTFKSETDTEVILASYKEWGIDCLKKFNGMWAFVIFDCKKKILFGSRDRMGVKPFYYLLDKEKFLFASEIKALLAHPEVKARPNSKIVWDYLICGLVDHTEETFFEGIKELKAGYYFLFRNKKLTLKKYWDIDPSKKTFFKNDQEYYLRYKELITDSVRLRLRSDVPLGTCLSGGLDSSTIVCLINDLLKKEGKIAQVGRWQKTFSAVYDPRKYRGCDERRFIREVIKKTKAQAFYVFPKDTDLVKSIYQLAWHQETPFSSTSIFSQWNVFRLAKEKKVKVLLDGQGPDEQLGYPELFGIYLLDLLKHFRVGKFLTESFGYNRSHQQSVMIIFRDLFNGLLRRGLFGSQLTKIFQQKEEELLIFDPKFRSAYKAPQMAMPTKNIFLNALYNSTKLGLSSLLRFEDRNSMAFSIESRVPFLDYRLIEFVFSLPDDLKIRHGQTKWIMRQALRGVLPEKIRNRQDKIGFATPQETWLKEGLKKEFERVLLSERFLSRDFIKKGAAEKIIQEFLEGKLTNNMLFWRLYNLEIWFEIFID